MASIPKYVIRLMKREEIPKALAMMKESGYAQGTHSYYTWHEFDPNGFFVAATRSGEILGSCTAVSHHKDLTYISNCLVRKEYKKLGIGTELLKACFAYSGDSNAIADIKPKYKDFYYDTGPLQIQETRYRIMRFSTDKSVDITSLKNEVDGVEILPLTEKHLSLALEYDEDLMKYDRSKAINLTVNEKGSVSSIALQNGKCVGYGTLRMCILGRRDVGPLYADSPEIAEVLLRRMIEASPQANGLAMFAISTNHEAMDIADKTGMIYSWNSMRISSKSKYDVERSKTFGLLNICLAPY